MEDLRYPVGRFTFSGKLTDIQIHNAIDDINATLVALQYLLFLFRQIKTPQSIPGHFSADRQR
jgi:hypothetical protein